MAGHSCAPGSGVSVGGRAGHHGGEEVGRSHPAGWVPLCSPSVPTEMISECFREDRSFLSPCDSSLIFWPALSPPMVWEFGSRNQKQSSHHGLTMGSCQPEAQASFLPGRGSALICPVEFCGFVRQAEAHSQNWQPCHGHRLRLCSLVPTCLRLCV